MGFDNQLFTFFRDEQSEGISITIIGSPKATLPRNAIPLAYNSNDTSIQTERPSIRIDRDASTQDYSDRARERYYCDDLARPEQENNKMKREVNRERRRHRARGKYNRELDLRYLNIKSLKDMLYSAYSCNQNQCRMIRDRMEAHQQGFHGGKTSEASSSFHGSKIKNSVSFKSGPSCNEIIRSKTCAKCPLAKTSSCKTKSTRTRKININHSRDFNDYCTKPHTDTKPAKNLRNEKKSYCDRCSSPCDVIARKCNDIRKYVDGFTSPFNSTTINKDSIHVKTSKRSEKKVDASPNHIDRNVGESYYQKRCIVVEEPPNYNESNVKYMFDYRNNCEQYGRSHNQCCDTKAYNTSSHVNDYTDPCVIIDNRKNLLSCCSDSDGCTTTNSNNISAPTFSVSCDITANDCSGFSTDNQAATSGDNLIFINKQRDKTNNINKAELKTANTKQELTATFGSFTKLTTDAKDQQCSKSKLDCRDTIQSSTSYKYAADLNSLNYNNSEHSICSIISRNDSGTNPIFKEVKEWIQEVPRYHGLDKQVKEDNKKIIDNLVKNLYSLDREMENKGLEDNEFHEKVRNEISACLSKITFWCPGIKREQKFKRNLVERLYQRIKNRNKKKYSSKEKHNRINGVTDVRDSTMSCNQTFNLPHLLVNTEVKTCIMDWLKSIYPNVKLSDEIDNKTTNLAKFVIKHVNPIFSEQIHEDKYKVALKTTITGLMTDCFVINPKIENMHIERLAEKIADKLLSIKAKNSDQYEFSQYTPIPKYCDECLSPLDLSYFPNGLSICKDIKNCFEDACLNCNYSVIEEAGTILYNSFNIPNPEGKRRARNEIINLLVTSTNLSEDESCQLAKLIMLKVRKSMEKCYETNSTQTNALFYLPNNISVYTSIEDTTKTNHPITSTPKKNRGKKEIPRFNNEEMKYTAEVSELIRAWIDTLPKTFNAPDEQEYKETIIWDLANDITDGLKIEQLVGPKEDRRDLLKYIVCRWALRIEEFELESRDLLKDIDIFLDTVVEIPVPELLQPQHGNRQDTAAICFENRSNPKPSERLLQRGSVVLEDQISMWLNEQPSSIFTETDKRNRQVKVHDLAQVLKNNLGSKRPETEVVSDISQWLDDIVRAEKRNYISKLAENLKNRLINLPQDATMAADLEERVKCERERIKEKAALANAPAKIYESADQENTMTIFISNFIERHYDVEDSLARCAFNRLLKSELLRLSNPTKNEIYEKFEQGKSNNIFPSRNMVKELEYIKYISDWLKNLPVDAAFHTVGNRERSEFINSLAESIREIEENREREPNAIDYNVYLYIMIEEHIQLLPMTKPQQAQSVFLVQQLYQKIIALRETVAEIAEVNESMNSTGVNADNIGDLIEEFIKVNGGDIAHDEVKMEAWAIRLVREIKKLVQGTSQPIVFSKAQVYEKLADIPMPSDETAKYFNIEYDYVIEITNWMKNLPFLPLNESERDNVINKICQLSEEMVETDKKIDSNPCEKGTFEDDLKSYIENWISELPLDKEQNIVMPVVVNQLLNRMEKLKRKNIEPELIISIPKPKKSILFNKTKKNKNISSGDLVNAIEKWSNALPINAQNADVTLDIKNGITTRILRRVGQLNMNPTTYNDDILYEDNLRDEIDANFDNLPQNTELQSKKEKLKTDLVNTIIAIKNDIKEKTAGEAYKIRLEKTIDASIPNPIPCYQVYDPGFEIYKNRLATMFILENFDHGADVVKLKHEQLLKKEIDKYFEFAKHRNAAPLNKDQLYTELYSHLFKVPVPNVASVVNEVEKLKTRCEIDAWFEDIPLREAYDLNELLEWDKLLSSLATHIHEIETSESKPNDKILKEIIKCLLKLPIQPENENKIEEYAGELLKKLKSTTNQRKCIPESPKKGKKDKSKAQKESKPLHDLPEAQKFSKNRKPQRKNAADEICDIVQTWCNSLPMTYENDQINQAMRDNLTTQIMSTISELNRNPEIFNNDAIYDKVLGDEIERLLSSFLSCGECLNKAAIINQLKIAIKSIKFLVDEENATHQYKQDLTNIVEKVLEKPKNISCQGKEAFLESLKNDIIDDFFQYKYSNDNDEEKQYRKINMEDNISTYKIVAQGKNKEIGSQNAPKTENFMKTNQIINELAKVYPKNDKIVIDEIEEIRMKKQVELFFEQLHIPGKKDDTFKVKNLKDFLAKKLNDIELHGYTQENENKMKKEIERCLTKLGKDKNQSVIDAFVAKLKSNEILRRMPQNEEKVSPDSFEDYCKGVCNTDSAAPADFIKNAFNAKSRDRISDNDDLGHGRKTCPDNESEEESYSGEEDGTTDDSKTLCLCKKKSNGKRKKPYCMVPVRYLYGCKGYDSLWCRMPIPGFFYK